MGTDADVRSFNAIARAAGALWLITVVCGLFAEALARGRLIVTDNAGATAHNIMDPKRFFVSDW